MAKKKPPKKGLPALLKNVHPALKVLDTMMRLSPSEEEFKGVTERIAKENMDLVNKVLKIILPDPRQEWTDSGPGFIEDEGLRQFAKKQIKKAPNPKGLRTVVDQKGLPRLVYHATSSPEPFPEFHTESRFKDASEVTKGFLSTGTDRREMQRWHPGKEGGFREVIGHEAGEDDYDKPIYGEMAEGSRTLPGILRAKNVFDHRNSEHIEMLRNSLIEERVEILKNILSPDDNMAVTMDRLKEAYRYPDGTIKASKEAIQKQLDHNIMMRDQMAGNIRNEIEKIKHPNYLRSISHGNWMEIEDNRRYLKRLGFDAFTTRESGQNIMLTDPAEQFVPLFDPEKKNPMGYTQGGKI